MLNIVVCDNYIIINIIIAGIIVCSTLGLLTALY